MAAPAFVFFAAAAAFTPLLQSLIPDVVSGEAAYARALALTRGAATLEAVLSPALAGLALTVLDLRWLFVLAAVCFLGSIAALRSARLGRRAGTPPLRAPFVERLTRGLGIYVRTPRLRGLFVLNLALSLPLAWVLANSVGLAAASLGAAERLCPILMAAYGTGAALGALAVPRLLRCISERRLIARGALVFAGLSPRVLAGLRALGFLSVWAGFGVASSLVLTPGGLVLTRSAEGARRPAVFAAHFPASHAEWPPSYPLAGWLGRAVGLGPSPRASRFGPCGSGPSTIP